MISTFAFILALAYALVEGAKLSIPVSQNRNERTIRQLSRRDERFGAQKPINNNTATGSSLINVGTESHSTRPTIPVEATGLFLYTTNISLGTPPQSFRAVVELNALDLFVPSIDCGGGHCSDGPKSKYDPSKSSTFYENGTILRKEYIDTMAWGIVGEETLRLGELAVPNQEFVDLKYYEMVFPDDDGTNFDSVLGMGYSGFMFEDERAPNILSSPFRSMVDQGLLPANKFGLQMPKDEDSPGELTIGGYNEDLVSEPLVSHPLYPENTTEWQVQATSISMTGNDCGEDVLLFNETLDDHKAALWTTFPGLLLPYDIGEKVLWKINHKTSRCTWMPIVDCDTLVDLPEIRLGFSGGQEIVLKGEDYTMLFEEESTVSCHHPVRECWLLIEPADPRGEIPNDLLVLGSSFLKSVYTVFDWDSKSVAFSKINS